MKSAKISISQSSIDTFQNKLLFFLKKSFSAEIRLPFAGVSSLPRSPLSNKIPARGFSLVELITVLVIVSLLALFAAPEILNWEPKMQLKGMAEKLVEELQLAKMYAIKNNTSVEFTITAAGSCPGGSYSITDTTTGDEVAADTMNDATDLDRTQNVCLKNSNFATAAPLDGFTSLGLPINPNSRTITLTSTDLIESGDPTYVITMSSAGGISLQKVAIP